MDVHQGSRETYDFIHRWISPDFFFSINDQWHRMGMLGVFGDYVLNCTSGAIFEIGVGESSIYLASLARKYNRVIYHCDCGRGKIDNPLTVPGYLAPERSVFFRQASDWAFSEQNPVKIAPLALAFIDGDHNYKAAISDFNNLLPLLVDNGYILLHDTYPPDEDYIDENHCGSVYVLRQELERDNRFDCLTLPKGCCMGVGLTICRKKPVGRPFYQE